LALMETAHVFREAFRETDILARLSGDEFAAVLVGGMGEGAESTLRRFEEALKEHNSYSGRNFKLSVSVGVAGYSLYWDDLIGYAYYRSLYDAQVGLMYVQFAFHFILTIIFVITAITLSGAFKRQMGHPDVVTSQMLKWVMPCLIGRASYSLITTIISGTNKRLTTEYLYRLGLADVIVNGAFWCLVLYGFIKTAADPGPWDWSHIQAQQAQKPQMVPYGVQAFPAQLALYPHPSSLPQGPWGQNNDQQQHVYQPHPPTSTPV